MALNAKRDLLAFYTEAESQGKIIVLKADLSKEFNRLETGLMEAKSLVWCGNDAPILTYPDRIVLVGPRQYEIQDLRTKTAGIKIFNEIDGMRVVSSENTFFLERVQQPMVRTFKIASTTPGAKLLNAMKAVDLNIPRADEIIREVGDKIIEGIEVLLDTATCEHINIQIMKHLLNTASFAKKFVDPNEFDANKYVNIVKHMIILTKLRNSSCCARSITYKQFEKFKAKNILKLLLKYRDYKLAIILVDTLNLKQYLPQVYEDWCITMLKYSKMSDQELLHRLLDKFDSLTQKLALEHGIVIPTQPKGENKDMGSADKNPKGGQMT
mmetsp:Transcript_27223/g.26264  ORF Transcript_27223/g.26264 Transcript_27223/m.26264 type:complete len:326 (-) Transcript_27223:1065-2042(-)